MVMNMYPARASCKQSLADILYHHDAGKIGREDVHMFLMEMHSVYSTLLSRSHTQHATHLCKDNNSFQDVHLDHDAPMTT